MSSCGNSSNITGNLSVNQFNNVGSRLIVPIGYEGFSAGDEVNYGWRSHDSHIIESGATAGDAIMFDVRTHIFEAGADAGAGAQIANPSLNKFIPSLATSAETAEVFGVIESIDGGIAQVVLSGQINYPMDKIIEDSRSVTGAAGGNDVFFLSAATAGNLVNLAPETVTHIAKPVMTGATLGNYNAVVNNYIGYAIGGSVSGEDHGYAPVGSLVWVPEGTLDTFYSNVTWRDARTAHIIKTDSKHSDLLTTYSRNGVPLYGHTVEATPATGFNTNALHAGKSFTQGTVTGTVSHIENEKWYFNVPAGSSTISNGTVKINGANFTVTGSNISHFNTVAFPEKTERTVRGDGNTETMVMIPLLKVSNEQGITIPTMLHIGSGYFDDLLSAKSKDCDGVSVGPYDVACKISDFELAVL
jgi:hypothetical protein